MAEPRTELPDPSCPIQTKNHFEHDEKIRELIQENDTLKFVMERTPRLLAQRIIDLEKMKVRTTSSQDLVTLKTEINKLRVENANLVKQMKEINAVLQDATQ